MTVSYVLATSDLYTYMKKHHTEHKNVLLEKILKFYVEN